MPQWTKQQLQAIEAQHSNLLVAASAGSGKTAVLVQRILHLVINQQVDIDRFLVVTFTQAAAAEMRERISTALTEALDSRGENAHLRRQLLLLNQADISTIHAFCNEVVRSYFHLIDIDPRYRIADQTEAGLIKMEVLEELLESEYELANPDFLQLADMFSSTRDDTPFRNLILQIYDFIHSQPDPLLWLQQKIDMFKINADNSSRQPWVMELFSLIDLRLKAAREILEAALAKAQMPGGSFRYQETLEIDLEQISALELAFASHDLSHFYELLLTLSAPRLKSLEKDADKSLAEEIKELRKEAREIIKQLNNELLPRDPVQLLNELRQLHQILQPLYQLVEQFNNQYAARKAEKGFLDFHDLEHCALDILRYPEAAANYRQRFEYIFVDEYQDSNPVQEKLLMQIKREDNLFMVGDVKQSIYRFRLSDPGLFIDKYQNFNNEPDDINRRINLDQNFRCSQPIIDAVNCLFGHIMSEQLGEVAYDEEVKLVHGSNELPLGQPNVEVLIIDQGAEGEDEDDELLEEISQVEVEARIVAARIKELLTQQIYDPQLEQYRSVRYRDIVVLMRATQKWAGVFHEVFLTENIPCYADVSNGYFDAVEIRIFLDLLRLVDNKRQDIPLVGVLRSPIFNFSVDDLITIRTSSQEESFYEAIESYLDKNNDELAQRLQLVIDKFKQWKQDARLLTLDTFLWKVMLETGFYHYVGAMPGGIQRQANLRILHERARQFQNSSFKGLFQFLRFIDQIKASSGDMDIARVLGENDDVVRLMSIHKSKGLEFPIVIAAGLGRQFNIRDSNAALLLHKDLGLGPSYIDLQLRARMETLARKVIRQRIRLENLSEEMRILYVACTRPKNKLILIGSVRKLGRSIQKWAKPLVVHRLSQARCFLDWLGPIIMRHPEGEELRKQLTASWEEPIIHDTCKWQLQVLTRYDLGEQIMMKRQRVLETEKIWSGSAQIAASVEQDTVFSILDWKYPYADSATLPSKLFVTQIREEIQMTPERLNIQIPEVIPRPQFINQSPSLTALQRGTAMHIVMQHLGRVNMDGDMAALSDLLEILIEKEILSPQEAAAVDLEAIQAFVNSPLGERIKKSARVFREAPFNLLCPANEVLPWAEDNGETLLVQGVVDLYFEEEDGLILVDYKTDRLTGYNRRERMEYYQRQLSWYRRALEQIRRKPVKEIYLYFFDTHELVQL